MKIDFVSNSSSTSFVYISENDLTKADFFLASGIDEASPVSGLFSEMFYDLSDRIKSGDLLTSPEEVDNLEERDEFTPETLQKMKDAIGAGKQVVVSKLSSESSLAEGILATEIFEVDSDKFLVSAYSNYW